MIVRSVCVALAGYTWASKVLPVVCALLLPCHECLPPPLPLNPLNVLIVCVALAGYTWAAKVLPFLRALLLGAASRNLVYLREHYSRVIVALEGLEGEAGSRGGELAAAYRLPVLPAAQPPPTTGEGRHDFVSKTAADCSYRTVVVSIYRPSC